MNKQAIINKLQENYDSFINYVDTLNNEELLFNQNNKWTAAQQLEHIYLSVRPVRIGLGLPLMILKILFGLNKRKSRSYEEGIEKYILKLENGSKASTPFIPKVVGIDKVQKLKIKLKKEITKLIVKIEKLTENDLDIYLMPHPILGKLTLREMLHFTIYHVNHHQNQIQHNLK